jgi:hypothetical protein
MTIASPSWLIHLAIIMKDMGGELKSNHLTLRYWIVWVLWIFCKYFVCLPKKKKTKKKDARKDFQAPLTRSYWN